MTDVGFFAQHVLGYNLGKVHERMLSDLYGKDGKNECICVQAARGHLKTTIFSVIYPLWRLWIEHDYEICLTSSSFDQSKHVLEIVKDLMETNALLCDMIPPWSRAAVWNKGEIQTINHNRYFIKPFNPTIRGSHVNLYICDDILREEDTTHDQIKDKFWTLVFPCVQTKRGQLIVVGTPMTTDDLLAELSGNDTETGLPKHPGWHCSKYPACNLTDEGKLTEPLWFENFTIDRLETIRNSQGALIFDREYLINPLAGGSALFPGDILRRQLWRPPVLNKPRNNCNYYIGVDISLSQDSKADWTVISLVEKDEFATCRLVIFERFKTLDSAYIKSRVIHWGVKFNARKIVVEDRGLSQGIAIDLGLDNTVGLLIEKFKTNRNNKEELVSHLQAGFQNGVLFIPENPLLLSELSHFGIKKDRMGKETYEALGGHDDIVMSLGLAFEGATTLKGTGCSFEVV